ncbi:MAG: hypothetical protein F7B11_01990 [Caldisphaeraceae archaeon]|nr:hypothetical protein [Caldisphaeraceae archaeon]
MALGTPSEYLNRLRARQDRLNIYVGGEKVNDVTSNPVLKPVINVILKTYELALNEEYRGILTAKNWKGEEVSRLVNVEMSIEDLLLRAESQRILNYRISNCNYRCTGHDGINALFASTFDIDNKYNTDYHRRFLEWLEEVQSKDLVVETAMTDAKGDRSKGPLEQGNEMAYLRIVERRRDGIVVRGAKMHVTGAALADELLVVPTKGMKELEKDYAVAFSIKPDTENIYFISAWHPMDVMKKVSSDMGSESDYPSPFGHRSTYIVIFDDVFVPKERVFMEGQYEFTGKLVEYFAAHHRAGGGACKAGFADSILGSAALAADVNGVLNTSYIQGRLLDIMRHGEAAYASGIAAMAKGWKHPSGEYIPNFRLANIAKLDAIEHLKEAIVAAADVGGGITVNAPSIKDIKVGEKVSLAIKGNSSYTPEERLRAIRLLQLWVAGPHLVGVIQGGGSPAAELLSLRSEMRSKIQELIDNAKVVSGIKGKEGKGAAS